MFQAKAAIGNDTKTGIVTAVVCILLMVVAAVLHKRRKSDLVQIVSTHQDGAAGAAGAAGVGGRYLKRKSTGALSMFALNEANKSRGSLWRELSQKKSGEDAAPQRAHTASISSLPVFPEEVEPVEYLDVAPRAAHRGSVQAARPFLSPVRHASILEEEEPEEEDNHFQFITADVEIATTTNSGASNNMVVYDDNTASHAVDAPPRRLTLRNGEEMFNERRLKNNLKSSEHLFGAGQRVSFNEV